MVLYDTGRPASARRAPSPTRATAAPRPGGGNLRVLHVTEAYGGGVEAVIAQYREQPGVDSTVLARSREGSRTGHAHAAPVGVTEVSSRAGLLRAWLGVRRGDYDVVHVHSTVAGLMVRVLRPRRGAAIVYTPHAFAFLGYGRRWMRRVVHVAECVLIARTDVGAAVSLHEAREFAALGLPEERIAYVPHQLTPASPAVPKVERYPRRVVGIGRLCDQKDPELFAAVARASRTQAASGAIEFVWIGDGDDRLRETLADAGVAVLGWLPRCEVMEHLRSATAVLHTAKYEGMPVCLLEAMASGTPIVARQIPSVSELSAPLLFSRPEESVDALVRVLDDEALWQRLASAGMREVQEEFSAKAQAASLEHVYRTAMARAAARV
ncbi:glycosyltransferase family 4 protein [Demequina sp. NBRC 110055]|uniref:glycosyltransferase family 4 protein n=1 Tax=Demequina sp. NBRC 110055 TaxID=1570344 RepID=UPI0009FD05FD|nr:glycosyltransferase family 4 protein [Demequina sp. NBRC 110055]